MDVNVCLYPSHRSSLELKTRVVCGLGLTLPVCNGEELPSSVFLQKNKLAHKLVCKQCNRDPQHSQSVDSLQSVLGLIQFIALTRI